MESPGHVSDLVGRSRPLKRFCRLLAEQPLLVIPFFLAAYGCAWVDVADFRLLSSAPLALHPDLRRQFLQYSPLTYFLGYVPTMAVGAAWSYALVMGGGLLLSAFALRHLATVRYRAHHREAMLMFFATPTLIVLTQYIGKSDPYIVAFLLLLAASRSALSQTLFAGLLVSSHLEVGLLVLASAALLRIVPLRSAVLGGAAGAALMIGYLYYVLPLPPMSRVDIGRQLLAESTEAVLSTPVLHLALSFGPFWLCVVTATRSLDRRWLIAAVATAIVASSTLDFTRVFTLVGLPLFIATVDHIVARSDAAHGEWPASGWRLALPWCAFFQGHLISQNVYDSRMPELIVRLIADVR